jgi:phosphoserine phosphatase
MLKNPLVIDFDGTLIDGDLLIDSILVKIKKNPFYLLKAVFRTFMGRSYIKYKMYKDDDYLRPNQLKYNITLINYINNQKNKRKEIIICTAANEDAVRVIINQIKDDIGIIEVVGSNKNINLKGKNKAKYLLNRYGDKKFDYIGDSRSDVHIWKYAKKKICVQFNNHTPSYAKLDGIKLMLKCKTCALH